MAIRERELIGMLLPDVSIDEIILETRKSANNKEGLKVTINFSVYDVVEDNQVSRWFDQEEFKSLIKISLSHNTSFAPLPLASFTLSDLEEEVNNSPLSYSSSLARVRDVDEDGRMLNQFKFSRSYDYNYCPTNLSYSISTSLDIFRMYRRYGIDLTAEMIPGGNHKSSMEQVFKDGKLGLSKIYLVERSGVIWNGPRHKMKDSNKFMTGARHDDLSETLVERTIKNYKIQDFRVLSAVEKFEIDDSIFHSLQEEISPGDGPSIERLRSDFHSEIWLSRSLSGEARLMFALDLREMVRNKGIFGKLLDKMPEIMQAELLSHCKVESIKLLRKRVRETNVFNKLGNQTKGFTDFDNHRRHEALVMSGETTQGFKRVDEDLASIRESSISTDESNPFIKFFTATDKSMMKITDGLYQYGVEVNIIDGTRNFLIEMKNSLFEARSGLVEILEKMNKAEPVQDYVYDPVTNTYIKEFSFSEDEREKILKVFRSYVTIMLAFDSLDADFFRALLAVYKSPQYVNQVVKSMDTIISKLERITNDKTTYFEPSRKSGKISSSEKFSIKSSKFFTNQIFDSNIDKGKGLEFLKNPTDERAGNILQDFSDRVTTIGLRIVDSAEWQQRVQSEIDRFYSSPNPSFSPPSNGDIAQEETIVIRGINSSYLTPSFIFLDSELDQPISPEVNSSEERTLQSEDAILSSNQGNRDYFSQLGVSFYEESEEALLINEDIGVRKVEKVPSCILTNRNIRQSPIDALKGWYIENGIVKMLETEGLPPEEQMSSLQQVTTEVTNITDIRKQPPVSKAHEFGVNSFTRIFKESVVKGINKDLNFESYEQPTQPVERFKEFSALPKKLKNNFKDLPLQIQSLFLLESDSSKVRFVDVPPSPSKFRINFNFLMAVEYLSGFGDDNLHFENGRKRKNFKMIKEPVWRPFTTEKFLASRGEEILCRLKNSAIKELGVKVQENLDLPTYDSYFIIRPPATNEGEVVIDRLEDSLRRAEEQELILTRGVDFASQEQANEQAASQTAQMLSSKADAQQRWDELTKREAELEQQISLNVSEIDRIEVFILENPRDGSRANNEISINNLRKENRDLRTKLFNVKAEKLEITRVYGINTRSSESMLESYLEFMREMATLEYLRSLEADAQRQRQEERDAQREEREAPLNEARDAATSIFRGFLGSFGGGGY